MVRTLAAHLADWAAMPVRVRPSGSASTALTGRQFAKVWWPEGRASTWRPMPGGGVYVLGVAALDDPAGGGELGVDREADSFAGAGVVTSSTKDGASGLGERSCRRRQAQCARAFARMPQRCDSSRYVRFSRSRSASQPRSTCPRGPPTSPPLELTDLTFPVSQNR